MRHFRVVWLMYGKAVGRITKRRALPVRPGPSESLGVFEGAQDENRVGGAVMAAVLAALTASTADASYCGAARYLPVQARVLLPSACCPQQCYTVMKTLPGGRLREAASHLLQDLLRAGLRAEDDHLHEVRPGDLLPRMHLHGLQAGLGNADQGDHYTVCKPVWETRDEADLLHGLQAGVGDLPRTCTYTVCKPVWETRDKQICYTVCKPV